MVELVQHFWLNELGVELNIKHLTTHHGKIKTSFQLILFNDLDDIKALIWISYYKYNLMIITQEYSANILSWDTKGLS